ncbi:hypothetical protein B0H14DRAFT_2541307 [Mycena olivaceomarginata]|nr:hypothetical protein B0H14DRAFT_2541307 [Mycena olivaceomarginata]
MSDATVPPPFVPQAPFHGPGGDVILRSSDGIDFYVYRIVLSLVSPIFEHMFSSPQPQSESDTLPVVQMAESAIILDRSLRFFYPGAEPVVDGLDQLCDILELLIGKYDAQSLVSLGKRYLRDYIDTEPLGCFAVAIRQGWQDIARTAARKCLSLPLLHCLPTSFPTCGNMRQGPHTTSCSNIITAVGKQPVRHGETSRG